MSLCIIVQLAGCTSTSIEETKHNQAYIELREQGGEFRYTAPLVEGVVIQVNTLPPAQKWQDIVKNLPENLKELYEGTSVR